MKKAIWIGVAAVLVAVPAAVGLLALRDDDESSSARRAAALVQVASAAASYQLVVDGITKPDTAIQVTAYSWGVKGPPRSSGQLTSGTPQLGNLEVTKKIDETSPLFVKSATIGTKHPSVVLTIYGAGGGPQYAKYTLENAYVDNVQHGGNADDVPTEQISIGYTKLTTEISSGGEGGKSGPAQMFTYDLLQAKS